MALKTGMAATPLFRVFEDQPLTKVPTRPPGSPVDDFLGLLKTLLFAAGNKRELL